MKKQLKDVTLGEYRNKYGNRVCVDCEVKAKCELLRDVELISTPDLTQEIEVTVNPVEDNELKGA